MDTRRPYNKQESVFTKSTELVIKELTRRVEILEYKVMELSDKVNEIENPPQGGGDK